jgi:hypothetical protein
MMGVRAVGCVDSPDDGTNPGDGGKDQIRDGAEDEDVESGIVFLEQNEFETENAVSEGEQSPGEQAGEEKLRGSAIKAQERDTSEHGEKSAGNDIAFHGDGIEEWNAICDQNPGGENNGKGNTGINARSCGNVSHEAEPRKSGKRN